MYCLSLLRALHVFLYFFFSAFSRWSSHLPTEPHTPCSAPRFLIKLLVLKKRKSNLTGLHGCEPAPLCRMCTLLVGYTVNGCFGYADLKKLILVSWGWIYIFLCTEITFSLCEFGWILNSNGIHKLCCTHVRNNLNLYIFNNNICFFQFFQMRL